MTPLNPPVRRRASGRTVLAAVSALLAAGAALAPPGAQAMPAEPVPAPQVAVTQVYAASTAVTSGTTVRTSTVVRSTSSTAQPARTLRLYLTDGTRTYRLDAAATPPLAPRTSATVRTTSPAPLVAPAGRYAVRSCLGSLGAQVCRVSSTSVVVGRARLTASPTAVSFGSVPVGLTSDAESVTVTNTGHARSGAVTVATNGDPAFTVDSSTCGTSLDPGDSCRVTVEFAPTAPGATSAALVLSSTRGGVRSVALSGTGLGAATLSIGPVDALFEDTLVGSASDPVTFTVTNDGNLTSGTPSVGAGTIYDRRDLEVFDVTGTTCTAPLAPAATCTVTVVFSPESRGGYGGRLTVSADPGDSATARLAGTGLQPATLAPDQTDVSFEATVLGDESDARTITLTNTGDVTSGVPNLAVSGPDAAVFTIRSTSCTSALQPAASCSVDVVFAPTARGDASAALEAVAGPGGRVTVNLNGTGQTQPALSISETAHDYGFTDAPNEHTFTVTNTGSRASSAPVVALTGSDAFAVTTDTCTAALPGGGTCTVGVTYTGSGPAEQTGQLSVSATPGGTVTADLSGDPQALTVTPTPYGFGGVPVGTTSEPATFYLTNNRLTATQVDTENVTGPFAVDRSCSSVVIPSGGICAFSATFAPTQAGPATGTLDYTSQGTSARVDLFGTGLTPAALSASPSTVDFGAYAPGSTGTQSVTFTNTGTEDTPPLRVTAADNFNAAGFTVQDNACPAVLPGGASCTLTLAFSPTSFGDKASSLALAGAPGGAISLVGLGAPAGVSLFPATYDYGAVPVGGAAFFTFRVVNTTANGEDMNSASSGPPFPLELNQDFTCVLVISTIQPHRWCTMTLSFKPQSVGSFSTTLTAGGTSFNTQSQLFGTGVPARTTSTSVASPGSMPTGVALRGGEVVVRRD